MDDQTGANSMQADTSALSVADKRRAVLMANLEKARQKRKETSELNKQTRGAERTLAKKRAEARLAELKSEQDDLDQKIQPKPSTQAETTTTTKRRSKKKTTPPPPPPVSDVEEEEEEEEEEVEEEEPPKTRRRPTIRRSQRMRQISAPDPVAGERQRLMDSFRQAEMSAAFNSLFPGWRIV